MNNLTRFDVLIVYAHSVAQSASVQTAKNVCPFRIGSRNDSYNIVYGYFLKTCEKLGLKAAFTTSADIIKPGVCQSYWTYKNNHWAKINSPCHSDLIFDKFSPTTPKNKSSRQLLFSNKSVKPFNDPYLFDIFFDKQKTYNKLSSHSIPTVPIEGDTLIEINQACRSLKKIISVHPGSADFSSDLIMKDRYGAGGRRVYKFEEGQANLMLATLHRNSRVSYILQPFTRFDQGFSYRESYALTDIRLVYLKSRIVQSYIRVAKPGEFRCNEHRGGLLTYLSLKEIPKALVAKSNKIAEFLNKSCSLYALDFIISNYGNIYLLEGNTGPGLDWNVSLSKNEIKAKKLIRLVVKELALRAKPKQEPPPTTYTPQSIPSSCNQNTYQIS